MARVRKTCKSGGVAAQIELKTNLTMRKFCELNDLRYESVRKGYYAKRTIKVLESYGIKIKKNLASSAKACA